MEVSWWYCWVTVISLVTNFHGCLGWPTLQPPLRPVTSKHELDSDESRKVLGSSVVTSVSVIMDHGNGTKTFLSDGIENPELKTNIIGSPGNLLNPDKYEFYTFDETGDLVKRLMTWDEIQGLIAGGEGESLLGEASMPMYYSDSLPEKMGSTHITANDFQTSDIQGVHKVVESVQNVLKSELAASQNKMPPIAKPPFISNAPNWSLFLPSILDNAEDGSELNNLPGMLVSPSALHTSSTTGEKSTLSSLTGLSGTTEVTSSDTNSTEVPTTTAAFTEITTTPFKEYTKKPEKPIRFKTTTTKPATPVKSTFTSSSSKIPNRPAGDTSIPTSTYSATPFKKYSTTKYGGYSSTDHWFSTSTLLPSTSKKNDYWYSTSSLVPTSSKKNDFWYSTASTEPTSSKKMETWFSTTNVSPTSPKRIFTSSKYGGYLANDESTSTVNSFVTRKPPPLSNKFGESLTTDEYGWPIATTESTSTSRKALTTSKYGGYSTNNELFASIANVLHQVTDNAKPTGPPVTSSNPTSANKPTTQQYKVSTEANRFTTFNKFQYRPSTELNIPVTSIENKTAFTTESTRSTSVPEIFKTSSTVPQKFSAEPTRFTVTLENHRPLHTLSHKFTTENSKFTEKSNPFQHKFSTESYIPLETHKTVSPFHKFTSSTSNKYFTPDSLKIGSSTSQHISTEPTRHTPQNMFKTTTSYHSTESGISEAPTSTIHSESTSVDSISSETSSEVGTSGGLNNYTPLSVSTTKQNDSFKTTKTSLSSTALPMAHVTLQKQPLTMKPSKPTKASITKGTIRPSSYTSSQSVTRPHSTVTTSIVTEKPLVRISTFSSTVPESTTNHPETLVTWISTFPLEETPSKVALNGVFDSDKLVTEQYVSSYHNKQPTNEDFFRNVTTASTIKESTSSSNFLNTSATENHPTVSPLSSSSSSSLSSSSHTKFGLHLTTLPHSSGSTHTSIKNNISTAASPTFESVHPFRTSERPFYTIESKTEPINLSTISHRYSTPSHHIIHTVPTEYTEIRVIKTTLKPATVPALSTYNYSSSETVMQRVPTINPPSKVHLNSSSTSGPKSSTRPQFLSTESTKNITQIAVMLNKSNDTSLRLDLQQRTKVTSRPMFETTKPIDCITSSMPNNTSDNIKLSANPYSTSSPVASSQKENSHIYYYKLPAITSSPQHELHIYHHKATSTSTTTETISNASTPPSLNRKPESGTTLKSSSEKEYQKITTVNHPSSDIIQNGISAVTNILLQTEGRIPNKEFVESDTASNTPNSTASIYAGINSSTPSRLITEAMLRTESLQSQTRSATTNSSANYTLLSTTPVPSSKPENHTNPATPYIPSTTINILESISTSIKPSSTTSSSATTSTTNPAPTTITKITTNNSTTEIISSTDPNSEITVAPTTTFSSDLRNDFVLDDQNITREEEEDIKNYHSQTLSSANRSGNVIKNSTSPVTSPPTSTLAWVEPPKLKITSTVKPSTNIAPKNTSSSNRNNITTTTTTSTTPAFITTSVPTNFTTLSTTTNVGIKIENVVKADNKSDHSADIPPPQSAFRSPLNPTSKVPASGSTGNGVELHPAPHESMGLEASVAYLGDDVKRFIDFCNELSFKIWTSQTGKSLVTSRSIVLSPFAVLSTLAMIFLGARGSSSGIMNDFLRLDDMVTFNPHQVVQNITESVVNAKNIGVANAAFVREVFSDKSKGKVLDFYKERLQQYYDTHVEEITFNVIGDLVRRRTNLLVKRQTQGKIQDYLRGSALVLKPPLAVLTANIFQTDCDIASTEGRDGEMYFVVRPSTRQRRLVPIPAVVYRTGFLAGYEPGLDATAVTLNPESAVSTILVLPGQQGQVAPGDGLARLEQRLLESSYRRGAWSRLLRSLLFRPGLELQIPRFSHKSVLNLTAGLQKMGMADIFTADKADLRGINGVSNELHLSDIVQVNTFSTCGEETVDARHHIETYPSSPQRVGRNSDIFDHTFLDDSVNNYYSSLPLNLRPRQARLPDNPRLRFDRPFLYIVRHNPTGLILYIGRFNPRLLP